MRPLNNAKLIALYDSDEEFVSRELYKVVDGITLSKLLSLQLNAIVPSIVRNNSCEKEAICISNCDATTSLCQASFVALGKSLESRSVRRCHHAGHIYHIKGGLILDSEDIGSLDLQNVRDTLLKSQLSCFAPLSRTLCLLELEEESAITTEGQSLSIGGFFTLLKRH